MKKLLSLFIVSLFFGSSCSKKTDEPKPQDSNIAKQGSPREGGNGTISFAKKILQNPGETIILTVTNNGGFYYFCSGGNRAKMITLQQYNGGAAVGPKIHLLYRDGRSGANPDFPTMNDGQLTSYPLPPGEWRINIFYGPVNKNADQELSDPDYFLWQYARSSNFPSDDNIDVFKYYSNEQPPIDQIIMVTAQDGFNLNWAKAGIKPQLFKPSK
jgi:hypothetical protein